LASGLVPTILPVPRIRRHAPVPPVTFSVPVYATPAIVGSVAGGTGGASVVTNAILNVPLIVPVSKNSLNGPVKSPVVSELRVTTEESFWTPKPNGLPQFAEPKLAAVGAGCGIVANRSSLQVTLRVFAWAADAGTATMAHAAMSAAQPLRPAPRSRDEVFMGGPSQWVRRPSRMASVRPRSRRAAARRLSDRSPAVAPAARRLSDRSRRGRSSTRAASLRPR
jgi:hypothetical protein